MDAELLDISEVSKLLGMSERTVRRKIPLKLVPQPLKRSSKTEPLQWRKADIAKFTKSNQLTAANDDSYLSIDLIIERMVETKVEAIVNERLDILVARRLQELTQIQ